MCCRCQIAQVNIAPIRNAAANEGVPFVDLRAVSALRVADALAPLLAQLGSDWRPPEHLGARNHNMGRELRQAELQEDGGDELLQLLWQAEARRAGGTASSSSAHAGGAAPAGMRIRGGDSAAAQRAGPLSGGAGDLLASLAAASAGVDVAATASGSSSGAGFKGALLEQQAARMIDPFDWMSPAYLDVEDDRQRLLPRNPTARLGERYPLIRPIKHGAQLRRKRLRKVLWEQERAPW